MLHELLINTLLKKVKNEISFIVYSLHQSINKFQFYIMCCTGIHDKVSILHYL